MDTAVPQPVIDGSKARVTRWDLAPGAETGHHRHELDYIVIAITDGALLQKSEDAEVSVPLSPGSAYFREAGVEHNVSNQGDKTVTFVEVELHDAT
ncbi:cupin domain-containing protein [Salinibacterium sp. TMP30]|uniref:cupin domain-containing protein n=1 Tax=Salinibacterium sp. TMP30 TaxID=3138237 RepID=UPI003139E1FC